MAAPSSPDRLEEHAWLPQGHAPFAGKYTVERILGQGGMGVVFEARHIRLGQRVAIKVLGSELREFPELVQRFEREARACGALTSTHSVRVYDIDATDDGTPFIVMELLAGRDLGCIIDRDGPQPIARSVRWLIEACDAIAEAHRLGIVHRDIKPSNLFLTDVEGRKLVKVLDFGIAKRVSTQEVAITQAVAPLGTPQYMSPEQVRCAKDVDARTDVWSLGVTLYELVTGQTPFAHESSSACIASIAADPVPDPRALRAELPLEFVDVLMKALAKRADDRFQSVEELVEALAPFAAYEDENEEMVSAVRRAFVFAGAAKTPRDQATLDAATVQDEEPVFELSPSPVGSFEVVVPAGPAREALESRSDHTVPPAVSRSSVAPPARRFKSAIAMASAAALGLAALVLTPKCVAPPSESSASAAIHTTAAIGAAHVSATAPVAAPVAPPVEAALAVAEAAAEPAPAVAEAPVAPAPRAVASVAPSARAAASAAKRVDLRPAPAPVAVTTARSGVHGGLSNPGF